eukprot:snap_masked-scaffold_59-processed-gene-0.30-mRNA-1 protein AED:1.00 eAED:1.00 QI:0/0/0/0/1/1/2/0/63
MIVTFLGIDEVASLLSVTTSFSKAIEVVDKIRAKVSFSRGEHKNIVLFQVLGTKFLQTQVRYS